MPLIVLHATTRSRETDLERDAGAMGSHYGEVIHLRADENSEWEGLAPSVATVVHILAHGGGGAATKSAEGPHVADMKESTFRDWMVNKFQMRSAKQAEQKFFIYSCDIATGTDSMLARLANYVANEHIANRTFIGTIGPNAVIHDGDNRGKVVVVKDKGKTQLPIGTGWNAYRTKKKAAPASAAASSKKETKKEKRKGKSEATAPGVVAEELGTQRAKTLVMECMNRW